jgi:hypothetical protein
VGVREISSAETTFGWTSGRSHSHRPIATTNPTARRRMDTGMGRMGLW